MANNYEQFSEMIECHTAIQRKWLLDKLDQEGGDEMKVSPCEFAPQGETQVWVYTDDWADTEELADILQSYLRKFDLDDHIIISISYSCSKPRPGEFGGYAMGIMRDGIETLDARGAMDELLTNGDR